MNKGLTVESAINEYKESLQSQAHSKATKRDYELKAELFLGYLLKNNIKLIQNVNHYHIHAFLEDISLARNLSEKTRYKYFVVLKSIFNELETIGVIESNPFQCLTLKKPKEVIVQKFFCSKAVDMLLDLVKNQTDSFHSLMDYAYALFLSETGLRRTDSINLKWNNINMMDRTIMFYISKNHSYIKIPMSGKLFDSFLNLYKIDRPKQYDYVFQERPGVILNINNMTARFSNCVAELREIYPVERIDDSSLSEYFPLPETITPHTLKHSFITKKFIEGYSVIEISELTGNKDLQTILKYRDSIPTDAYLLANALNKIMDAA